MNGRFSIIALGMAAALLPGPALMPGAARADEIDHASEYRSCMVLVKRSPEEAFESAITWRDMGGGAPAKHCVAAALVGLGQHDEAARRFEELAEEIKGKPLFKAELLGQASQAWLLAGSNGRAEAAVTAALKLNPMNEALLVDRAMARAAMTLYKAAIEDLDLVIEVNPLLADAFVYRASAQRLLDNLERAEADIKRALELDGAHREGLLERGNIRRLKGDNAGARADWLKVLTDAPGTPAAEAAQNNLQKMDVNQSKE